MIKMVWSLYIKNNISSGVSLLIIIIFVNCNFTVIQNGKIRIQDLKEPNVYMTKKLRE